MEAALSLENAPPSSHCESLLTCGAVFNVNPPRDFIQRFIEQIPTGPILEAGLCWMQGAGEQNSCLPHTFSARRARGQNPRWDSGSRALLQIRALPRLQPLLSSGQLEGSQAQWAGVTGQIQAGFPAVLSISWATFPLSSPVYGTGAHLFFQVL